MNYCLDWYLQFCGTLLWEVWWVCDLGTLQTCIVAVSVQVSHFGQPDRQLPWTHALHHRRYTKNCRWQKNEVQYKEFARNWERVHDVSCERCEGWEYCLYKLLMMQRNGNAQTGSYSSGNDKTSKYLRLDINWLFNKRTRHVCHCLQSAGFNLRAGETRG